MYEVETENDCHSIDGNAFSIDEQGYLTIKKAHDTVAVYAPGRWWNIRVEVSDE